MDDANLQAADPHLSPGQLAAFNPPSEPQLRPGLLASLQMPSEPSVKPSGLTGNLQQQAQQATGNPHADGLSNFIKVNMQLEGTGKDPRSSAVSGWIKDDWREITRGEPEVQGKDEDQILAMRDDNSPAGLAFKAHMTGKRTELNGQELAKSGVPVNDGTLRLAFVFGAHGAKRIAQADPNTRIEAIDPAAVSANPEFAGLTAGQVMQGMAEQIATGKDPFAHRRADGEWGVDKADEFRRQGEADAQRIEQDRAEYLAAAEKAPEGSAVRAQMLHEAHDASRRATEQYDKLLKAPPVYHPTDAFAGFGGVLMALAAFAGGRAAQPLTGSLTAMSGMLDGMNQGNKEAYDRAYHIWDMQTEGALKLVNIQNNEIRNILEDQRMADNEKAAHLQTRFAAYQMHESAAALREGNWMKVWQMHESSQNFAEKVKEHYDNINEREEDRKSREKIAAERQTSDDQRNLFDDLQAARAGGDQDQIKAAQQAIEDFNAVHGKRGSSAANNSQHLHDAIITEWQSKPENEGKPVPPDVEVKAWTQAISRNPGGTLPPDTAKFLAKMYEAGDPTVITSLPRGPARIDVEKQVTEDVKELPGGIEGGAAQIVMNRLRMAEARSAATTAGRITMQTGLYSREAAGAGALVLEASEAVPRTEMPTVNRALQAYYTQTGDPKIIELGVRLNALYNAYGKLSNPTGTGVHDADKARIEKKLDEGLSKGQMRAAIDSVIKEGINVAQAAEKAQHEVLTNLTPTGLSGASGGAKGMDFSAATIDDLLKVIDDPSLTNEQRRAIDARLKELGH